jgi:hypothetical protein
MVDYLALLILSGVASLLATQHLAICVCSIQQITDFLAVEVAEDYQRFCTFKLALATSSKNMDFAQQKPTPVYEDNTACIEWGNNVICFRECAKHIHIRKHFAHELIQNGHMRWSAPLPLFNWRTY